ncbi:MAG: sugar phosphate isomerase/epimerase family protein [Planctomycetota bacterium]|jgi:sugar phosphate isomerase/epimerase
MPSRPATTTRRDFLRTTAAGLLAVGTAQFAAAEKNKRSNPICVFTKPFNSISFDELADRIAEMGFDGIEAPIRPGGHIEPEQVPDELPKLVDALRKRDLEITVLTSSINDPSDPVSERVLRTASGLGIKRYRMKYFHYDFSKPILPQLDGWRPQLKELAALNAELGMTAVYQNHAGVRYVGAALWDLPRLLEGIDIKHIGVAYDIRHATVEGGMAWPATFHMIRPHIDTVYVKDFVWGDKRPKNVPLGEGRISSDFFRMLADSNFNGPISLHEEYLDHRNPSLVPQHLEAISRDFQTLKSMLSS